MAKPRGAFLGRLYTMFPNAQHGCDAISKISGLNRRPLFDLRISLPFRPLSLLLTTTRLADDVVWRGEDIIKDPSLFMEGRGTEEKCFLVLIFYQANLIAR